MNKPNFSKMIRSVQMTMAKHSPEILTGIGIAGMVTTTIMAVKATPKAMKLLEEEQQHHDEPLTKTETIKAAWKPYIPAAVTGTISVACLIGANSVSARRNAVLATAYNLSETALTEYKEKVVETVGEKKEKEIRDKVAKEHVEKNPVKPEEVIITGMGNTLCRDAVSGRYFESDIEFIRKTVNELNRRLISEMYIPLNDFYYEIKLEPNGMGNDLGWNVDRGLIELDVSAQMAWNERPCLEISYSVAPQYDFRSLM